MTLRPPHRAAVVLAGLWGIGCSAEPLGPGTLVLLEPVGESLWTLPGAERVELWKREDGVAPRRLEERPAPAPRLPLDQGAVGGYDVLLGDGASVVVARGRSLAVDPLGFSGSELALLVAPTERVTRAPGAFPELGTPRTAAAVSLGRFVVVAAGGDEGRAYLDAYDLGGWSSSRRSYSVPCAEERCAPRVMATDGRGLALVLGEGLALAVDLVEGGWLEPQAPPGVAWTEVAKGRPVVGASGQTFLLGATREDREASTAVRLGAAGTLAAITGGAARRHAAATYVAGRGVVVVGGSETAPGVELLPEGSTAFVTLGHPPDGTRGAAVLPLAGAVLRLGGVDPRGDAAPTVRLGLDCGATCAPEPAGPPVSLGEPSAHWLEAPPGGQPTAVLVGREAGRWRVVRLVVSEDGTLLETGDYAVPAELRDGIALTLPTGHLGLAAARDERGSWLGVLLP